MGGEAEGNTMVLRSLRELEGNGLPGSLESLALWAISLDHSGVRVQGKETSWMELPIHTQIRKRFLRRALEAPPPLL